ncbi:MAG: caspase family protein [Opitutales bacterium]
MRILSLLSMLLLPAAALQAQSASWQTLATEPKTAFIIGCSNYEVANPLADPLNDARDMRAALQPLGFEVVYREDPSRADFDAALGQFLAALNRKGGVAVFYFSGHGAAHQGTNYLIPVGRSDEQSVSRFINVGSTLDRMKQTRARASVMILDACRSPLTQPVDDSLTYGLVAMPTEIDTFLAFSTAPGRYAYDGPGRNSLYTEALVRKIGEPYAPIEEVFKAVRVYIREKSRQEQIPWEYSSLSGDIYFNVKGQAPAAVATQTPVLTASTPKPEATASKRHGLQGTYRLTHGAFSSQKLEVSGSAGSPRVTLMQGGASIRASSVQMDEQTGSLAFTIETRQMGFPVKIHYTLTLIDDELVGISLSEDKKQRKNLLYERI